MNTTDSVEWWDENLNAYRTIEYKRTGYHYIELEIDGDQCTISTRYPNGEMLQGPGNAYPQQWVLTK